MKVRGTMRQSRQTASRKDRKNFPDRARKTDTVATQKVTELAGVTSAKTW